MDRVLTHLAEQHAELDRLISALDEQQWGVASRCEGWTIADVVLHLEQTDRMALASLQDRFGDLIAELSAGLEPTTSIDEGAARMVASERGDAGAVVADRWRARAGELRAALANDDPHRRVQWVAGHLSVRTLASTRLAEAWIHTGDVAAALGVELPATDRLEHIARLAWRTLPYAFAGAGRSLAGPVAFHLRAPGGGEWSFRPDDEPVTTINGSALDLCLLAGQRVRPADTALTGEGPDAAAVLDLVRTYA